MYRKGAVKSGNTDSSIVIPKHMVGGQFQIKVEGLRNTNVTILPV